MINAENKEDGESEAVVSSKQLVFMRIVTLNDVGLIVFEFSSDTFLKRVVARSIKVRSDIVWYVETRLYEWCGDHLDNSRRESSPLLLDSVEVRLMTLG